MAIAFVNRSSVGGGTTGSASIVSNAANHTTGNLLVALIFYQGGSTTVTGITDTAGNLGWAAATTTTQVWGGANNNTTIWFCQNCTGNAANVVTAALSGTGTYRCIVVQQFSGVATASAQDAGSTGQSSSASLATGSLAISGASAVICAVMEADAQGLTAGSGYSLVAFGSPGDATQYFAEEYKIVSASETASATCNSGAWGISGAAFKVASGAAARGLFRTPSLSGVGIGGSFFRDPLQGRRL